MIDPLSDRLLSEEGHVFELMAFEIQSPSAQVAAYLREELLAGTWRNQLPGTPALAGELEVDRKTVTAALQLLEEEGLLQPQGLGRPRKVVLPKKLLHNRLNIRILLYEESDGLAPYVLELIRRVELKGHRIRSARKSLMQLGMNADKVVRYVEKNPADAWMVLAGSKAGAFHLASSGKCALLESRL